jgi:drug/metabolite transporter (DMT)-like permease
MVSILFAIISYFGWGIGDIFGTIAARKIGGYSKAFWTFIIGIIIGSVFVPFNFYQLSHLTYPILAINILLGLLLISGFVAFNEALRIANPSLVGTISSSFAALTVVLSMIIFKEPVSSTQIVAMFIIFFGLLLGTLNISELRKGKLFNRGILLALFTMFCWGIAYTFIKIPIQAIGWFWPIYIYLFLSPIILLFMKVKKIPLQKPTSNNALLSLVLSTILIATAEYSFNFAISKGYTSIVAPIVGSSPTLFAVIAFFVFKDKITKQQIAGVFATLVGIVLLSIESS